HGTPGDDETHGRQRYSTGVPLRDSPHKSGHTVAGCVPNRLVRSWPRAYGVCRRSSVVHSASPLPHSLPVRPLIGVARGEPMSLDVSPALLEQAERGEVDEADFVDCVRTSLPYAWEMISSLVVQLKVDGGEFADNQTPPPDEHARGELLRALASNAIRGALER